MRRLPRRSLDVLQVNFGQHYAAERYAALMVFRDQTPSWMTLVYAFGVLLCPVLCMMVWQFPLDPVSQGLSGNNYYILLVVFMASVFAASTIVVRLQVMLPDTSLTRAQSGLACVAFVVGGVGAALLIGQWVFPIPFSFVTLGGFGMALMLSVWFWFEAPAQRRELRIPLTSLFLSYCSLVIHEAIGVVYVDQNEPDAPMCHRLSFAVDQIRNSICPNETIASLS